MTKKELEQVVDVLNKIKNKDAFVHEALCSVQRDIERRRQQSKMQIENKLGGYDYSF